jgi:putative DNA primase/helicase
MNNPNTLTPPDGVPESAWCKIARVEGSRWSIAERNAVGEVIGTAYRMADGSKDFKRGGKRGLILPWPLAAYAGSAAANPIFVCEGASDTAVMLDLGFDAVGIPMAGHCGAMLAELLADRHVVIVRDADQAGRDGTDKIVNALNMCCPSVRAIDAPNGAKDARAAVIAGADRDAFLALVKDSKPIAPKPVPIDGDPVIVRLSDVKPESVAWLWRGRIALGKLTLIAGDPGLGKSFVTLDIAARVSRGKPWPDAPELTMTPGGVVLLSAEDGVADTIRPRLDAAGADVDRIVALDAIRAVASNGRESARTFDLSRDLPGLESAIRSVENCRLVVIDPVTAYLGRSDSHNNAEIRGLLAPLGAIAERHGVAVIAVTHLNKAGGGPAIYRAMGSLAFAAAARAAWAVSKDKDDPKRRLLLSIKNNIASDGGGLAYRIEPVGVDGCPVVAWEPDPVNVSADDALSGQRDDQGGSALDEAKEWLRDMLVNGSRPANEIKETAEREGIKERTLQRAKKALGVVADREGFAEAGRWVWAMPQSVPT